MASRKLQGEIERVLKKVDEGVGIFEQIWDKVYSATTTAQKEKYEGDLKKEIKKLQRLRDQIKTWQGDSSIKDKTKLDANRKLIEEKMEKFKVCEKETKTKAFSKEGLAQDRTDPKQKAKAAVGNWVGDAISSLKEQSDEMEAEIESLNSGKRKKRGEENPRVVDLKEHIARHEHHVGMLERVLRAVYNDGISPEEAADLKESVDYYIESNQEPDFYEDEEMYDTLNLEAVPTPAAVKKPQKPNEREEDEVMNGSQPPANRKGPPSPRNTRSTRVATAPVGIPAKTNANAAVPQVRSVSPPSGRGDKSPPSTSATSPRATMGLLAAREANGQRSGTAPLLSTVVKGVAPNVVVNTRSPSAPGPSSADASISRLPATAKQDATMPKRVPSSGMTPGLMREGPVISSANHPHQSDAVRNVGHDGGTVRPQKEQDTTKLNGKLNSMDPSLAALEMALNFMPETPSAALKQNPSTRTLGNGTAAPAQTSPRNPAATPPSFPSVPAPVFGSRDVFEKFDPDTLFFIFYYQQGTYQQYLAATELKRQGWRFHKKYLTWFQRHDEPKLSTDEFETGTFIYFDYANVVVRGQGSGWCQRIKSEFIFEYRFLEDELV